VKHEKKIKLKIININMFNIFIRHIDYLMRLILLFVVFALFGVAVQSLHYTPTYMYTPGIRGFAVGGNYRPTYGSFQASVPLYKTETVTIGAYATKDGKLGDFKPTSGGAFASIKF